MNVSDILLILIVIIYQINLTHSFVRGSKLLRRKYYVRLSAPDVDNVSPLKSNIDLFAADDRKPKSVVTVLSSPPTNTPNLMISSPAVSYLPGRSISIVEQQAELLRLEASKEQIQIDNQRIVEEKVFLSYTIINDKNNTRIYLSVLIIFC